MHNNKLRTIGPIKMSRNILWIRGASKRYLNRENTGKSISCILDIIISCIIIDKINKFHLIETNEFRWLTPKRSLLNKKTKYIVLLATNKICQRRRRWACLIRFRPRGGRRRGKAKVRRGGSETAKGLTRPGGGGRKDYGDRRS